MDLSLDVPVALHSVHLIKMKVDHRFFDPHISGKHFSAERKKSIRIHRRTPTKKCNRPPFRVTFSSFDSSKVWSEIIIDVGSFMKARGWQARKNEPVIKLRVKQISVLVARWFYSDEYRASLTFKETLLLILQRVHYVRELHALRGNVQWNAVWHPFSMKHAHFWWGVKVQLLFTLCDEWGAHFQNATHQNLLPREFTVLTVILHFKL